jgi:hypothetical protein
MKTGLASLRWPATASLALVGVAIIASTTVCTRQNPAWCDDRTACPGGQVCDPVRQECRSPGGPGGDPVDATMLPDHPDSDLAPTPTCPGGSSRECPGAMPVCQRRFCSPCGVASDGGVDGGGGTECALYHADTPYCGSAGSCVQCLGPADCAAAGKTCDLTAGACGACSRHDQCTTGICLDSGDCALASNVYFVDNRQKPPRDCAADLSAAGLTADGKSWNTAFCDLADAVAAVLRNPRPYISVAASSTAYGSFHINTSGLAAPLSLSLVSAVRLGAKASGGMGTPAIFLDQGQTPLTLSIDGFNLNAPSFPEQPSSVINCVGAAVPSTTLVVRRSQLSDARKYGVSVDSCQLTLDSVAIIDNGYGGVSINGKASYSITNTFIASNGSQNGDGVVLGNAAEGVFAWNTVTGNGSVLIKSNGGVRCGSDQRIESSIIFANSLLGGSQLSPSCQLLDVVTGTDNAVGAIAKDPSFTRCPQVFGAQLASCLAAGSVGVDLVPDGGADGGARTLVDHDFFGVHRPLGKGYDVGAQEAF